MLMPPPCPDPSENTMASLLLASTSCLASSFESGIHTMKLSMSFGPPVQGFIDSNTSGQTLKACMTSCSGALCDLTYLFAVQAICFSSGCDLGRVAILVVALYISL